jgi:DnaJ domain
MTPAEALRTFELDDRCTPEQVRAAYRELVKVWHPDRFANDAGLRAKADRRLQEINRAYAVLQDRADTADPPREATPRPEAQDRAETVETPREATPPRHAATPPPGAQSRPARWSVAPLVIIGLLTGASLVGIVMMLVRPPQEAPAPVSGTDLLAGPVAGEGSLIVLNADRRDAVLVFVVGGIQTRAVYLRAGERLQMLDVSPGAYRIWVAAGRGWSRDHFATDQLFQEIGEPLTFANDVRALQTITIAAPGTGTSSRLRARSPFVLKLQR